MSTRSSRHQTNELENPKLNENINSLWPQMCGEFATLEQHLLSRVKEDALERHDETFENETSVCDKEKLACRDRHDAERILHCPRKIGTSFASL